MNNRIINDITNYIFVDDEPRKSDVIFLPGGSDPAVPEKAAELYKEGFSAYLIPSGGVSVKTDKFNGVKRKAEIYNGDYKTECEFYTDVLIKNGVPQTAIFEESQSSYTKENALLSRKVTDERGLIFKTALLVCKAFHARRCLMCYQLAFPETDIRVIPIDVYDISSTNWYTHEYGVERVMGELYRCGNQFVDEMKRLIVNRKKYIENDVLCLAEVIESDYKTLYDSWNEEDTVLGYNYKLPHSFDEYCVKCREDSNWGAVIVRLEDNQVIGRIGISTGLPDLSITIFKPYRNQNYGTKAFLLGVTYCFEALNLEKIYAGSYEDNIASRKMIERCGFKPNPDGNLVESHIFSGEDRLQLDFVIENPRRAEK